MFMVEGSEECDLELADTIRLPGTWKEERRQGRNGRHEDFS